MKNCVVVWMNKIMFGPASENACLDHTRHDLCQDFRHINHIFHVYRNFDTQQQKLLWRLQCGEDGNGNLHMYNTRMI